MAKADVLAKLVKIYSHTPAIDYVRTGIHALDLILGDGVPVGRIIEVFGPESGGKSLLAWHAAKAFQSLEGIAILYDVEATAPRKFMERVGVDAERLINRERKMDGKKETDEPLDTIEAIEDDIIRLLPRIRKAVKGPILIIWDSIAASSSKGEWDLDKKTQERVVTDRGYMANRARALSQALRRLTGPLNRNRATLMAINQIREKVGVVFGARTYTPGGRSFRHYSSIRIEMSRRGRINLDGKYVGVECHAQIEKSKITEPFREADLRIYWEAGFDPYSGLGDVLLKAGRLKPGKKAGTFVWNNVLVRRKNLPRLIEKRPQLLEPWL